MRTWPCINESIAASCLMRPERLQLPVDTLQRLGICGHVFLNGGSLALLGKGNGSWDSATGSSATPSAGQRCVLANRHHMPYACTAARWDSAVQQPGILTTSMLCLPTSAEQQLCLDPACCVQ